MATKSPQTYGPQRSQSALRTFVIIVAVVVSSTAFSAASAQELPVHRVEVSAGAGYLGGMALGDVDANLRSNSTTPQPYRLFSTSSELGGAPVAEVRVGFSLTRRIGIEGRVGVSRPELRTSVTADVEGGEEVTAVASLEHLLYDVGAVILLDRVRFGGTVPFVTAGGGYLVQMHDGQAIADGGGPVYYVGGGLKHWLFARSRGRLRGAGLRVDAALYVLSAGIAVEDRVRRQGKVSGSFFLTF